MQLPQEGSLLRILIGEADKYQHKPLYEWIVLQAREQGLAGATVLRGMMGFGANTRQIHTFRFDVLSEDMPVVVEIVDSEANLEKFLDLIEPAIKAGLVTMEKARVKFYRFEKKQG
jgi:PII-like signaling protein